MTLCHRGNGGIANKGFLDYEYRVVNYRDNDMSKLNLSEMGIDLTNELAQLMRLSTSDHWRVGVRFIKPFSEAIIKNDIKKLRALTQTYYCSICYPQSANWCSRFEKEFLPVFNAIKRKLYLICSVKSLLITFEVQSEYEGWGDIIVKELKKMQSKGISFINPDMYPYRYADYGITPIIEGWGIKELNKNKCPFDANTFYDVFFSFVESARNMDERKAESDYYSLYLKKPIFP